MRREHSLPRVRRRKSVMKAFKKSLGMSGNNGHDDDDDVIKAVGLGPLSVRCNFIRLA